MKVIATTPRLILREFELADAAGMVELNSAPDIKQFTGDDPFRSVLEAEEFLKKYDQYQLNGFGRWAMVLKTNNAFIGWCGLRKLNDIDVDLGYRIITGYRGKGYATEAAKACINFGFNKLELPRIIGRVVPNNESSIRVLQKVGMKYVSKTICEEHSAYLYEITK